MIIKAFAMREAAYIGVALTGLCLSAYSVGHDLQVKVLGHLDAMCDLSDYFSCSRVTLSAYSELAGVPLGVFGVGYFSCCLLAAAFGAARGRGLRLAAPMSLAGVVV